MSDLLDASDSDEEDGSRRHAAWALLVLAMIATILVAIMVFVLGTSPGSKSPQHPAAGGTPTSGASSTTKPQDRPSTRSSAGSSTPSTTTPKVDTAHPCPTNAACIVDGDVGGLIEAINKLRTDHGLPATPGTVSPEAQQCALQQGEGGSCQPHYAWQPVPSPNGTLVVAKIGAQWLLDPKMTSFRVGWAYLPGGPGAGGQWECAVLKFP